MDGGDNRTDDQCDPRYNMREDFVLSVKLIALLVIVIILSFGLVLCAALFIYLTFKYPESANTLLQFAIPAGISSLALVYGKKVARILNPKAESKLIEKDK